MATLTVGAGSQYQYQTISAAIAASHDGDVVQVQAGTYVNDSAIINTKITLQGVGGMVKMVETGWLSNDKGILVTNTDVTIDHFEFSGAIGSSGNDAGIRYQGGNLVITNSYFHDNQNGLLSNPSPTGTITIKNSEFAHNGTGDGLTHNIYVGEIASVNISDSYFHDAVVGNEIKSRAFSTTITNTRVFDNDGTSSWSIDLPNGGVAVLSNNVIEQGPNGQNTNVISFGVEGNLHSGSSLTMTNNTIVNDLATNSNVLQSVGGLPVTMTGTQVYSVSTGTIYNGTNVNVSGTVTLSSRPTLDMSHPFSDIGGGSSAGLVLNGTSVNETLLGGSGNDVITDVGGSNYIRGNDGDDSLTGGSGFDDMNGNKGNDTVHGGAGDDWVSGGQNDDMVYGDDGHDLVYGNLGNDTVYGGNGDDWIRGGQGNDIVDGGAGNDLIWGDRGDDTLTGGAGADVFHTFIGAGVDRITDFNGAEGDRIVIDDHGASFTVTASGNDTVITLSGSLSGDTVILQGVSLASFHNEWITTA